MSAISEAQDAFLQMRTDGQPLPVAAVIAGADEEEARRWEELEAGRRERLINAATRTADRLVEALRIADHAAIRRLLSDLDDERKDAALLVFASRQAGVVGECRCGHLDLFHNLSGKGERTDCSWHEGPQGAPCGCKRFIAPSESPPEETRRGTYERVGYDGPGSERTTQDVERRHQEFARLRAAGMSTVAAARQMGISSRTGARYEGQRQRRAARGAA